MSIRRRKWRDPKSGRVKAAWMIDVRAVGKDGVSRRVRRVIRWQRGASVAHLEERTREELQNKQARAEGAVGSPTLAEFVDSFLEYQARFGSEQAQQRNLRILRRHLLPAFGQFRLSHIGPDEFDAYADAKRKAGVAPKTLNHHLSVLRAVLAGALSLGFTQSIPPFRGLESRLLPVKFLSFEEVERLLEAAEPEWQPMILTAVRAGLRLSELLSLRWSDVDLERALISVPRCKRETSIDEDRRPRSVPLTSQLVATLRRLPHRSDLVFGNEDGSMLTRGSTKWPLIRALRRAGLPRMGWRGLRETMACHLVMRGAALKTVQEVLGYSAIELTLRYAHLSPETAREAVRLLDVKQRSVLCWQDSAGTVADVASFARSRRQRVSCQFGYSRGHRVRLTPSNETAQMQHRLVSWGT